VKEFSVEKESAPTGTTEVDESPSPASKVPVSVFRDPPPIRTSEKVFQHRKREQPESQTSTNNKTKKKNRRHPWQSEEKRPKEGSQLRG